MRARWVRIFVALVVVVGTLGAGGAEAKKKKKGAEPPPSDLPGRVAFLSWKLRGVHIDDATETTNAIQKLVVDHMQAWLPASPERANSVAVRREIEAVFEKIQYPITMQPACFVEPWKGGLVIGAGYSLGWTRFNRVNVVMLFEQRDGQTRLAAVTNFTPFVDLHYEFLPARDEAFRFFIWGTRPGKSQPRLSAALYAFDGQNLKSLWETHDVYDGKMDVEGEKVLIRYLKEDEYIREQIHGRKPPRHLATYNITPQGLEIETDREIPF
ncbi:MAG: hypothetical protein ACE145_10625 [Terriglobia bacterium]